MENNQANKNLFVMIFAIWVGAMGCFVGTELYSRIDLATTGIVYPIALVVHGFMMMCTLLLCFFITTAKNAGQAMEGGDE